MVVVVVVDESSADVARVGAEGSDRTRNAQRIKRIAVANNCDDSV